MKEAFKKIVCVLALLLWAGGIVCILITVIKTKALVPIFSAILVGLMSIPSAVKVYKYLIGNL